MTFIRNVTEEEWKKKLTPEQYHILREKGTEVPYSGKFFNNQERGMYKCVACGKELFASDTKFNSGTGWPSFNNPINREHIELREDRSDGMVRTEVVCKNCGSHLGHVFDDKRQKTGDYYCINSCALSFEPVK